MDTDQQFVPETLEVGELPAIWLKRHAANGQSEAAINDLLRYGLRVGGKPLSDVQARRVMAESNAWTVKQLEGVIGRIMRASGLEETPPGP